MISNFVIAWAVFAALAAGARLIGGYSQVAEWLGGVVSLIGTALLMASTAARTIRLDKG
jgi:hypothetical protein